MNSGIKTGMCVTSHNNSTTSTVKINSVSVTAGGTTPTPTPTPAATATPTPDSNAVNDGSFESGNLNSFTISGATISTSAAHAGSYGAVLTGTASYVSQNIASRLTAGVQYTISAWVRVTSVGGSWGQPRLRCCKYQDLGTSDYGEAFSQDNIGAGWQYLRFTHTFTTTDLAGNVFVGVVHFGMPGVSNVDEITVR